MECPAADITCWGIYRLDLQTQQVSKNPGSDGLLATRLSRDGHFLAALPRNQSRVMLYDDLSTQKWSELAKAFGSIAWSHDSKSIYLHLKHETRPAELVRISVPDGHVQRVLDLTGLTLAAFGTIGSVFLPMILPCSCSTGARKKSIDSIFSTVDWTKNTDAWLVVLIGHLRVILRFRRPFVLFVPITDQASI